MLHLACPRHRRNREIHHHEPQIPHPLRFFRIIVLIDIVFPLIPFLGFFFVIIRRVRFLALSRHRNDAPIRSRHFHPPALVSRLQFRRGVPFHRPRRREHLVNFNCRPLQNPRLG